MNQHSENLTGLKFGRLQVVAVDSIQQNTWKCICDCGKETIVSANKLKTGHTRSCGCLQREKAKLCNEKDFSGAVVGRWTVLRKIPDTRPAQYLCRCQCGTERILQYETLRSGRSKSCGCFRSERFSSAKTVHGKTFHPLHVVWSGIIGRTTCQSNSSFEQYGAKGIGVCEEWKDFQTFFQWAMEHGWKKNLQIDRIDNSKGYSPDNCRFISASENMRNRNCNRMITFRGETKCLAEWAEIYGIKLSTISKRLNRYHWDVERAITERPKH